MSKGTEQHTYDAIVIGLGHQRRMGREGTVRFGYKTLAYGARKKYRAYDKDYPAPPRKAPWDFPHRMEEPLQVLKDNPVISKCYAYGEDTHHFFVKDKEHPYIQEKPFDWIRGYQVGGKSIMWGRACQRWSDFEFSAPQRYGFAVDWPIRYADIAPWYSHVEKFSGICGDKDGLEALPDGDYLPPFEMTCVEEHIQQKINANVIKNAIW